MEAEDQTSKTGRRGQAMGKGNFSGEDAPVMKCKVRNVSPPASTGPESLTGEKMDASVFVASWDLMGRKMSDLVAVCDLIPDGFDMYMIGMQNCRSLTDAVDTCLEHLEDTGDYEEYTHLIANPGRLATSLAVMVFVRRNLVEEGSVSMSDVGMVRDRKLSTLPVLRNESFVTLSKPGDKPLEPEDADGGAVSMRFDFFDTNFLLVNIKESCVGELNEILARVDPASW